MPTTAQDVQLADLTVTSGLGDLTGNVNVGTTYVSGNWINNNEGASSSDSLDHTIASFTPSAAIGIGPDAVIASDNTLGTYSEYQGRLYVSFVFESKPTRDAGGTDTDIASIIPIMAVKAGHRIH